MTSNVGSKFIEKETTFGFIEPETENEKDVFVHISAVKTAGMFDLNEGDKLSFELETGDNGKISAIDLKKN